MAGQAPLPVTSKPKVFDVVGLPKKGEPGGRNLALGKWENDGKWRTCHFFLVKMTMNEVVELMFLGQQRNWAIGIEQTVSKVVSGEYSRGVE